MGMIQRGSTTHFIVSYDSTLTNGATLADAVLARCEPDLASLSALFGGLMPASTSLPFHINLVPGAGGAAHSTCLDTTIYCYISAASDVLGVPAVSSAEVAEVLMNTQAKGFDCGSSNGEGLSRVLATVLNPNLRNRFSTGNQWLNGGRPDWVTVTEPTDRNAVSTGCASLFLNYLAYQLGFSWPDIIKAAAPTLAQTASNLGVVGDIFGDFASVLAHAFPISKTASLPDDVPFPLPALDQPYQAAVTIDLAVGAEGQNAVVKVPVYKRLAIDFVSGVAFLPTGQKAGFTIETTLGGTMATHYLLAQPETFGSSQTYRFSELVRLYADPGSTVRCRLDRDAPTGTASARMTLAGRLVDR